MNVLVRRSFEKDVLKTKNKQLQNRVAAIIQTAQSAKDANEIPNLKKIIGYEYYYRIRVGDYRAGVEIIENDIDLIRFLHRKDIYKYFP